MSASSPDPAAAPPADEPGRRASPPRDFSELARRISGRTADLFAVALVAVLLLLMGGRLTQWWRAEPPAVVASPADSPLAIWDNSANLSVELAAGPWQLVRATVAGSAEDVTQAAIATARQTLDSLTIEKLPAADAAERQWLGQLRDWPPEVETTHGDIFVLGGPWPWVVATRSVTALAPSDGSLSAIEGQPTFAPLPGPPPGTGGGGDESPGERQHTRGGISESLEESPAADSRRVICWAFALPQSPRQWTLYSAARARGPDAHTAGTGIVIPADAQRLLTAQSTEGGLTSFRIDGSMLSVQADWTRQLIAAGWHSVSEWSGENAVRRATFQRQHRDSLERLDAALIDNSDTLTGIADWRRR